MDNRRNWVVAAVGAVVAAAAAVVAVVVGTQDDDTRGTSAPAVPATPTSEPASPTPTTAPTESPSGTVEPDGGTEIAVPVYLVGDTPTGPRLFREFHRLPAGESEAARVKLALVDAVGGEALDPDYRSDWPADTTVGAVAVGGTGAGDTVEIDLAGDLHDRPAAMTSAEAETAVQQLVHTIHAVLQRRPPVQLVLDGQVTDTILGVPTSEPLAAADPMDVQAPVWVTSPQDGDLVGTTFVVEGRGAFFEATVSWQLLRRGRVVDEGTAMAEEGNTLSPFSFTVRGVDPGRYVLRVYDADMSGGEGPGEQEDTKRIRVTD